MAKDKKKEEKQKLKKLPKKKKKEIKSQQKKAKKIHSTIDWIDIANFDENGIILERNQKRRYVRGIELQPVGFYMLTDKESQNMIDRISSAIDKLYLYELYFKFVKNEPEITLQSSEYLRMMENERDPSRIELYRIEIDKLEWFAQYNREVKMYVLIQEDELHIDKAFDQLYREFTSAWYPSQVAKMTYSDYKMLIEQELNNDTVDEYLYTQAILGDFYFTE